MRAILGTSVAGGAIGALLGALVPGLVAVIAPGTATLGTVAAGAAVMGLFGAFAAGGFATLLALSSKPRALSDLSTVKSAVFGLLAGAAFPTFAALVTAGRAFPMALSDLGWAGLVFGLLGSGLSAGLVSVAKHASERALPEPDASPQLDAPSSE